MLQAMKTTLRHRRLVMLTVAVVAMLLVGAACNAGTQPGPPEAMLRLLELVNQARADNGVAPLQPCGPLGLAAAAHSHDMAEHGFLGHTGSDGSQPDDRAVRFGYGSRFVGENAAVGPDTVEEVFLRWINSPGHRQNILDPAYQHAGFSWFGGYWTQVFGANGAC